MAPQPVSNTRADRSFAAFNAVVSVVALAFLFWLLVLRQANPDDAADLAFLPAVNASLNATAAALLIAGFYFIKKGRRRAHQFSMVGAFASSTLFLVSYIVYHYTHGDTRFTGTGPIRVVYFLILISHILLSIGIVPGALSAFWFAWRGAFPQHKRVTRLLLPAWLYVSVTGVVIFFLLRAWGA